MIYQGTAHYFKVGWLQKGGMDAEMVHGCKKGGCLLTGDCLQAVHKVFFLPCLSRWKVIRLSCSYNCIYELWLMKLKACAVKAFVGWSVLVLCG